MYTSTEVKATRLGLQLWRALPLGAGLEGEGEAKQAHWHGDSREETCCAVSGKLNISAVAYLFWWHCEVDNPEVLLQAVSHKHTARIQQVVQFEVCCLE
jgi:hypothetical protein